MLVTDTSGSMNATDVEPSRLEAAKDAADRFLDNVPDELRVGLVAFSDAPTTVLRPTEDRAPVRSAVDGLAAEGGTATGDALDSALRALGTRGEDAPPAAVVLLSDGATQTGRDPAAVAREAADAGVPVYTVALGTPEGEVEANGQILRVPPDPEALADVARLSGGGGLRRRGRRRARRGLRAAGLPDRHARGAARDQRRVRGRGPPPARRRDRRVAALARAAALTPIGVGSGRSRGSEEVGRAHSPGSRRALRPAGGVRAGGLGRPHAGAGDRRARRLAAVRARLPGRLAARVRGDAARARGRGARRVPGDVRRAGRSVRVQGGAERQLGRELRRRRRARRREHRAHRPRRPGHLHLRPRHPRHRRQRPQGPAERARRALAARGHDRVAAARRRGELPPPPRAGGRAGDRGRRDRGRVSAARARSRRAAGATCGRRSRTWRPSVRCACRPWRGGRRGSCSPASSSSPPTPPTARCSAPRASRSPACSTTSTPRRATPSSARSGGDGRPSLAVWAPTAKDVDLLVDPAGAIGEQRVAMRRGGRRHLARARRPVVARRGLPLRGLRLRAGGRRGRGEPRDRPVLRRADDELGALGARRPRRPGARAARLARAAQAAARPAGGRHDLRAARPRLLDLRRDRARRASRHVPRVHGRATATACGSCAGSRARA